MAHADSPQSSKTFHPVLLDGVHADPSGVSDNQPQSAHLEK